MFGWLEHFTPFDLWLAIATIVGLGLWALRIWKEEVYDDPVAEFRRREARRAGAQE